MMFWVEIALACLLLTVLFYDLLTYTIPNWLVLAVMALYVPVPFLAPVDWAWGLGMFGICLGVGFGMFAAGWIGGGDAKLLAALGLWTGKAAILPFLVNMALLGGVLSLLLLGARFALAWVAPGRVQREWFPRVLRRGAPVPYGVAIALGFLLMMVDQSAPLPF